MIVDLAFIRFLCIVSSIYKQNGKMNDPRPNKIKNYMHRRSIWDRNHIKLTSINHQDRVYAKKCQCKDIPVNNEEVLHRANTQRLQDMVAERLFRFKGYLLDDRHAKGALKWSPHVIWCLQWKRTTVQSTWTGIPSRSKLLAGRIENHCTPCVSSFAGRTKY